MSNDLSNAFQELAEDMAKVDVADMRRRMRRQKRKTGEAWTSSDDEFLRNEFKRLVSSASLDVGDFHVVAKA